MRNLVRRPRPGDVARNRVEPFSDGVFAIVGTLLVFRINPPELDHGDSAWFLALGLADLAPTFVSWVISFATVCVIWLNHCRLFNLVDRIDDRLFWLNANLLLWTSFLPFPTALMGDYPENPLAVTIYGASMLLVGIAFLLLRLHLLRRPELLREEVDLKEFRTGTIYSIVLGPGAYIAAITLGWVHAYLAFTCYAAIVVYWMFPHATRARR